MSRSRRMWLSKGDWLFLLFHFVCLLDTPSSRIGMGGGLSDKKGKIILIGFVFPVFKDSLSYLVHSVLLLLTDMSICPA